MDLDNMQSFLNEALTEKAIKTLTLYRDHEVSPATTPRSKEVMRLRAIQSLETVVTYLKGDYAIITTADARKAKELEEKEPQFIAVAEHNQQLTKELWILKDRWQRFHGDEENPTPPKKAEASKKKKSPKPAVKQAKKHVAKKKAAPKTKKLQCGKCQRIFKSAAGLTRHKHSCKG